MKKKMRRGTLTRWPTFGGRDVRCDAMRCDGAQRELVAAAVGALAAASHKQPTRMQRMHAPPALALALTHSRSAPAAASLAKSQNRAMSFGFVFVSS
ncbi:hypothetical protein PG997_014733 [Apiospora hydei]|uniref:DUF397 domain-containing protein n=1 Tax=Apiospora hydei TaxID=1337664 RepID=A0ABR1UUN3_9PEZI